MGTRTEEARDIDLLIYSQEVKSARKLLPTLPTYLAVEMENFFGKGRIAGNSSDRMDTIMIILETCVKTALPMAMDRHEWVLISYD